MKKHALLIYFTERFPFFGVLFIALTTIFATAGLYKNPPNTELVLKTSLIALSFIALLLRMRITDEFKDRKHDDIHFPDRPLQRKLVTIRQLYAVGITAFVAELMIVWAVGGTTSLLWYVPVLLYSWLMLQEFYARQWLKKHFSLYFILHEILFAFYAIWLIKVIDVPFDSHSFAWALSFVGLVVLIEIGRKFSIRRTPKGKIVHDTYTAVWGHALTVDILGIVCISTGIALSYAESSPVFALISAVAVCLFYVFKKHDTSIKVLIIIHSVLLIATGILT